MSFVSSGTPMPGQNPNLAYAQNYAETEAQYAAMLPTQFTTALPSFDLAGWLARYWWLLALGAAFLFWPKGRKGRG